MNNRQWKRWKKRWHSSKTWGSSQGLKYCYIKFFNDLYFALRNCHEAQLIKHTDRLIAWMVKEQKHIDSINSAYRNYNGRFTAET